MSKQIKQDKRVQQKDSEQIANKVNEDLIVHNMPDYDQIEGELPAKREENKFLLSQNKNSETDKLTGILIIVIGIILILALIYLGYRFIVKSPISLVNQSTSNITEINEDLTGDADEQTINNFEPNTDEFNDDLGEIEVNEPDITDIVVVEEDKEGEDYLFPEEGVILEDYIWTPLIDSDEDGLSNEEEASLGTDPNNYDTDGDGFSDLEELLNLYDPAGPGKLEENRYISGYQNDNLNYSILYPQTWNLEVDDRGYLVVITAPDNSLVQISVAENMRQESIASWYEAFISSNLDSQQIINHSDSWQSIQDGLYFYASDQDLQYIYTISYVPVISERLTYKNIFQMIINSFKLN